MSKSKFKPLWFEESCSVCGAEGLSTRAEDVLVNEIYTCNGCEAWGRGYKDGKAQVSDDYIKLQAEIKVLRTPEYLSLRAEIKRLREMKDRTLKEKNWLECRITAIEKNAQSIISILKGKIVI